MQPPRILIADDEQHIVQVLSLTLKREGYNVTTADDGDAAWMACERDRPDLIITDMAMPGLTGQELASRAAQMPDGRPVPVMIVTARQFAPAPSTPANIAAVLPKPFSPREILGRVADLVGQPYPHEEPNR